MFPEFRLKQRIGCGAFGDVYDGELVDSKEEIAIKISSDISMIKNEEAIYEKLSDAVGFPRFMGTGVDYDTGAIALELLGKSLDKLFEECNNKFSLKTVLMLADQMLARIEFLHSRNILHRDIKPSNFAIGLGPKSNQIFLYDFGLSIMNSRYSNLNQGEYSFMGTIRFASISSQEGNIPTRRDDLESFGYMLIYLLKGKLPWSHLTNENTGFKFQNVLASKTTTPLSDLCSGLPSEFVTFIERTRNLDNDQIPPYSEYRKMFRELFISLGYIYDNKFDWSNPRVPNFQFPVGKSHNITVHRSYRGIKNKIMNTQRIRDSLRLKKNVFPLGRQKQ